MNTATTPTNGTVRAAVYVRISQDKTGARAGVERQEDDCRVLADRLGWTVTRVYADNDISAYSGKPRPDYKLMLDDIAAGQIDAVLAWHPDRLHRSPKELEHYIDVCEAARIPTHTEQAGNWDLSTPAGRMVARQIGAVSRYESEHKSQRVKAARVQSACGMAGCGPTGIRVVSRKTRTGNRCRVSSRCKSCRMKPPRSRRCAMPSRPVSRCGRWWST